MASLTQTTALGGTIPFDETIGGNRIREVSEAAMASLAMLKGQGAAFKKAAASRLGELPAPGHAVGHAAGHGASRRTQPLNHSCAHRHGRPNAPTQARTRVRATTEHRHTGAHMQPHRCTGPRMQARLRAGVQVRGTQARRRAARRARKLAGTTACRHAGAHTGTRARRCTNASAQRRVGTQACRLTPTHTHAHPTGTHSHGRTAAHMYTGMRAHT